MGQKRISVGATSPTRSFSWNRSDEGPETMPVRAEEGFGIALAESLLWVASSDDCLLYQSVELWGEEGQVDDGFEKRVVSCPT